MMKYPDANTIYSSRIERFDSHANENYLTFIEKLFDRIFFPYQIEYERFSHVFITLFSEIEIILPS